MAGLRTCAALVCALLLAAHVSSAAAAEPSRQDQRQACYDKCMKKVGWHPVCVYSPNFPKPTPHLPTARWVMPNACAMRCQQRYAKYTEYFKLAVKKHVKHLPKTCRRNVQAIYFDWSKPAPKCTTC